MDRSEYPHLFPIVVEVEKGKKYTWCGCGQSESQPFCDREHCDKSLSFVAEQTEDITLCNCKQTKNPPFCDGSHAKLLLEIVKKRQLK